MSAPTDPKDTTSLEDIGTTLFNQSGQPAFDSPDGYTDAFDARDGQPRAMFDDDAAILKQGGQQSIDLAGLPNQPDLGYSLVSGLPASFEDLYAWFLSLDPEYSQITQDVDLHYHFTYTKPYLSQYYDTSLDAWNNPTLNNFTGYARDGYKYTNGVRDGDYRLMGVSVAGQKVYARAAGGGWSIFSNQPALSTGSLGYLCIGIPGGGLVVWRGVSGSEFCHYNVSTNTWSYKAAASTGAVGATGCGCALDAAHVYACGSGRVEKFDGVVWSNLTPTALSPAADHVWAQSADVLWAVVASGTALHYYNGSSWSNRFSEMVAAIGAVFSGYSLTSVHEVWSYGSNVYIIAGCSATAKQYVIKYDGTNWSVLGGVSASFYNMNAIWGTDDSHIWMSGRGPTASNIQVVFWNGSAWATQLSGPSTAGIQYAGKKLAGTGPLVLAASFYTSTNVVYETTNGTTWTQPTWPDAYPAVVITAVDFTPGSGGALAPWRAEASSANRSSRGDFPLKTLLVATNQELVIFDLDTFDGSASSLRVWMRFILGNSVSDFYALGRGVGSIQSVAFSNGVLLVGTKDTGWEVGRLHTIDFKALTPATVFSLLGNDGQWIGQGTKTIADRNTNSIWLSSGSYRITPSEVRSLSIFAEGTNTHYVALAGEDPGPQIVKFVGNVVQSVITASSDDPGGTNQGNYRQVMFDDVGWLWVSVGGHLYRNCRDWREGYIYPQPTDPRQGHVDLGVTITRLVHIKNSIYAATANGIYRVSKGSMEAYLAYTAVGGGGRGRLNVAGTGEKLAGQTSVIQSLHAYTLLTGTLVFGYLAIGTIYTGSETGGFTLLRVYDDVVTQAYVSPNLIDPGTYISSSMLA